MEISGMLLMLLLGLRHGFDPDHIAIIDAVGVRLTESRPGLVKWTGTLFAIGHGSIVTSISVMISLFSHSWDLSITAWKILDWLPGLILIGVGMMNLTSLLKRKGYKTKGVKILFMPRRLRESSNPLAIVLMGALFAMVFYTNTQAAAWSYTASSKLTIFSALELGFAFSTGMVITDTLDSRILSLLMKKTRENDSARSYRKKLGWIIVVLSILVGSYKIGTLIFPVLLLQEDVLTYLGILFFSVMALFYYYIYYQARKAQTNNYGHQGFNTD